MPRRSPKVNVTVVFNDDALKNNPKKFLEILYGEGILEDRDRLEEIFRRANERKVNNEQIS